MKKILNLVFTIFIFAGITSCNQELVEEVRGNLSSSTLTTENDAIALVDGIYSSLLGGGWGYYGYGEMTRLTDGITDIMTLGPNNNLETYRWQDENVGSGIWEAAYSMIGRANWAISLIENIDDSVFEDINTKNVLLGEAHFLRALGYFDLAGHFGGVPILTKPIESDVPALPRSSVSDVYTLVESDFQIAIDNLPNVATPGKATQGAALGLMAKTHLRQGKWEQANTYLDALIELGTYDLYTEGSFLELFFESRRLDNEFIFVALSMGEAYNIASNHHVKAFTPFSYDTGWTNSGIPESLFSTMESGDSRGDVYLDTFPYYTGGTGSALTDFGFVINRKFGHYNRDVTAPGNGYAAYGNYGISKLNAPILRYADILLLKADVENELNGPNAVAYDAINLVRSRVGLPNLEPGLSKTEFRDAVLNERALELVGEGQRKDDLIRHGLFESTITQYLIDQGYAATVTANHQLLPIPRVELDLNPNLEPNPSNDF